MTEQLNRIIFNLMNAKDQLTEADLNNPDIKGVLKEVEWQLKTFEEFSKRLADNIELTLKITNDIPVDKYEHLKESFTEMVSKLCLNQ